MNNSKEKHFIFIGSIYQKRSAERITREKHFKYFKYLRKWFLAERRKSKLDSSSAKKSPPGSVRNLFCQREGARSVAAGPAVSTIDQLDKSKHSREAYEPRRCLQRRLELGKHAE